jgi:hypothetical protein
MSDQLNPGFVAALVEVQKQFQHVLRLLDAVDPEEFQARLAAARSRPLAHLPELSIEERPESSDP